MFVKEAPWGHVSYPPDIPQVTRLRLYSSLVLMRMTWGRVPRSLFLNRINRKCRSDARYGYLAPVEHIQITPILKWLHSRFKIFWSDSRVVWICFEPTSGFIRNYLEVTHVILKWLHQLLLIKYFWSIVNIWNVNCARATAFIFDTRTDVLVKVSKFLRQKISLP